MKQNHNFKKDSDKDILDINNQKVTELKDGDSGIYGTNDSWKIKKLKNNKLAIILENYNNQNKFLIYKNSKIYQGDFYNEIKNYKTHEELFFNKTALDDIEKYEADKKKNFKTNFVDKNITVWTVENSKLKSWEFNTTKEDDKNITMIKTIYYYSKDYNETRSISNFKNK